MKKSVYLIILAVVTILCIIAGSSYNLRHAAKGMHKAGNAVRKSFSKDYRDYNDSADFDDDYEDLFDDDFDDDFEDRTQAFDSEELEKFDTLAVDGSVLAIEIERGNSYSISSKYNSKMLKPEYSLHNGRLYITQKKARRHLTVGNHKCRVKVTVPYGVTLDKLDIDVDVGAVQLNGFDVNKASVSTDVGAIQITNLDFSDMSVQSDVGAVSIELMEPVDNYNINASSDIGAIELNGDNVRHRYSSKGTNGKYLRIRTDVGGIEIK